MSNEAIQKIRAAESEAGEFIGKCASYNSDRIAQAKADAEIRYQAAERSCHAQVKQATEKAAEEALGNVKKKNDAAKTEADEICAAAAKKLPDAVKIIIREIIRKWQ